MGQHATAYATDTLWDLYLMAKAYDPALGGSQARVEARKADSDIIFSGLLPHVEASAGINHASHTLLNYGPEEKQDSFLGHTYSVTARAPLLHVPTLYGLSEAAAGVRYAEAGVSAVRQNLMLRLAEAYFGLLKARTNEQIAGEEISRLKQVLKQAQSFLQEGTGDIIAVYEAQARLDSVVADHSHAENSLRLAEQKLTSIIGKPISGIADYVPQQPKGPEPDHIDWWLATMAQQEPQIRQAQQGLAQAAEQRKAAKSEHLPTIQVSGGYAVSRGSAFLPEVETRQLFVGATLSLPLYSGGGTSARVRRATADEKERRYLLHEIQEKQSENVKLAFYNLRNNYSLINALQQRKASAEIQLQAVRKGRSIGTRSAIDVLNAEQAYSNALRDLKSALYDNIVRDLQLKAAAGISSETDLSSLMAAGSPKKNSGLQN